MGCSRRKAAFTEGGLGVGRAGLAQAHELCVRLRPLALQHSSLHGFTEIGPTLRDDCPKRHDERVQLSPGLWLAHSTNVSLQLQGTLYQLSSTPAVKPSTMIDGLPDIADRGKGQAADSCGIDSSHCVAPFRARRATTLRALRAAVLIALMRLRTDLRTASNCV